MCHFVYNRFQMPPQVQQRRTQAFFYNVLQCCADLSNLMANLLNIADPVWSDCKLPAFYPLHKHLYVLGLMYSIIKYMVSIFPFWHSRCVQTIRQAGIDKLTLNSNLHHLIATRKQRSEENPNHNIRNGIYLTQL